MIKNTILSFLKSPILHFVILGVIAFLAYEHLKPTNRETLRITTQTIDALIQQRESIVPNPVTPEERQQIIEGHIEDEVLLREAYKRGFDKNDYRVRKRLLNVMRSSLTEVIPEPSVAQLRAYYDANKERYKTSPSVSFDNIFFSFTSKKLPTEPQDFLIKINGTENPLEMGDFSLMGKSLKKNSFQMVASTYGKPFAETIFKLSIDTWSGPLESFRGIHYVRVTSHHDSELPPFEKLENYLRQDYLMQKMRDSQQKKIDKMREGYEVVVEGVEKTN